MILANQVLFYCNINLPQLMSNQMLENSQKIIYKIFQPATRGGWGGGWHSHITAVIFKYPSATEHGDCLHSADVAVKGLRCVTPRPCPWYPSANGFYNISYWFSYNWFPSQIFVWGAEREGKYLDSQIRDFKGCWYFNNCFIMAIFSDLLPVINKLPLGPSYITLTKAVE